MFVSVSDINPDTDVFIMKDCESGFGITHPICIFYYADEKYHVLGIRNFIDGEKIRTSVFRGVKENYPKDFLDRENALECETEWAIIAIKRFSNWEERQKFIRENYDNHDCTGMIWDWEMKYDNRYKHLWDELSDQYKQYEQYNEDELEEYDWDEE